VSKWRNIAPTQIVPIVRNRPGREKIVRQGEGRGRELATVRWGLIPAWAKDPAIGNRMINARAEGVADKPAFRSAFRARRCIVPASGFYEWVRPESRPGDCLALKSVARPAVPSAVP
jgi:putative SOS response-associated peptidase YedK